LTLIVIIKSRCFGKRGVTQTPGTFPGQKEANPKGYVNAVTIRDGDQLEDPVKKSKNIEGEVESNKLLSEEVIRKSKRPLESSTH